MLQASAVERASLKKTESPREEKDFSSLPVEQLFHLLHSSEKGITPSLAAKRVREQLKGIKKQSRFKRELKLLMRQFVNPLMLLLSVAVVLSASLGESSDAFIMLFILLATGLLSFWQEVNAGRAVEQLQEMIKMKHTVLRGGKKQQVPAEEVVRGDVVLLDAGDIIPADCRIIESNELHVNESSLTGESYPVEKSAGILTTAVPIHQKYNCLWQGTNVISGSAKAVAVYTGHSTYFGKMVGGLAQTPETAFEKGIKHFGYFLLRITIVLSIIILVANLYFKKPLFDSVLFSLALAVGMAPELLPAIMTFAMSVGAKRMMKKKVIVKKLSSIFNFGEVNVLCTDKTGTITEGKATVKEVIDVAGKTSEKIRRFAYLNATLQQGFTNPIDEALSSLSLSTEGYEKVNEIPYDFIRKRLSVAVTDGTNEFFITKGALMNVLEVCSFLETAGSTTVALGDVAKKEIENLFIKYSQEGYRVLGLAYKEMTTDKISRNDEKDMTFLGFILLEDPLKESTTASIERLEKLNIAIKIITGDNRYAASQAAQKIGMDSSVILTGDALNHLSPEALTVQAAQTAIFAEIEPFQKERIIKALQKSHLTVAYIGDGINDVAAIHAADIGISTNNATDVAREAADFVLLDKDLSVLADGIAEGRKSFANSMKYIFINTGSTFGNMFSVSGASLLLPFLPMLPKQILLTNLITSLPFLTIASDNVDSKELAKPRKWNIKMVRNFMIVFGLHSSLFDFITFYWLYHYFHLTGSPFQTGWFLESSLTQVLILYIVRTQQPILRSHPGKWLVITGGIAIVMTAYLPLSPFRNLLGFSIAHTQEVFAIAFILLLYVVSADLLKNIFFKWNKMQS